MNYLILPPLCFVIVFFTVWGVSKLLSMLALAPKYNPADGKDEAYGCGEVVRGKRIEPDYGAFFRFAVFFTIIDVAGLMAATLAAVNFTMLTAAIAILYTLTVSAVLAILYSK